MTTDITTAHSTIAGVDTHTDTHTVAAVTATGQHLATETFPATRTGYTHLTEFLSNHGVCTVGVEGTNSYGAGLTRHLIDRGYPVVEVLRPTRSIRRRDGISDPVDALAAARQVLTGEGLSTPKDSTGPVESLRALHIARKQLVSTTAKLITTIKSLLVTAPDDIRVRYSTMTNHRMINALVACRPSLDLIDPRNGVLTSLKILATTYRALRKQVDELETRIAALVAVINPHVSNIVGCGPIVVADLIISIGGNPERIHSEAALAHLCGAAPLPASSGRTNRHRLNRGGGRRANSALYRIAVVRMRCDQRTKDYVARRTAEGLSKKEIIRCLKRAIVREIYRVICTKRSTPQPRDLHRGELKELRIAKHLTQAVVADSLGCAPARISDIETGKRPLMELASAYEKFLESA
ncbi:Transposase IS116/IS110/IS902 family protein [Corynebacterium faecale]|uniref:IS110 family transposase n=1 Tax=Corynebacterium faecale TaxID=1758466 RepID=UPI0025B2BDA4|nr:IS110 family transposase [Corynebacterium faecale]WJY91881.1 Transposase IS116/IS110/IS902 family protein [Corynebacterium faecale]